MTINIPRPLKKETGSPKYTVLNATSKTCFTLAAIHSVSAEVTLLATKLLTFNANDKTPDNNTTFGAAPAAISGHRLIIS